MKLRKLELKDAPLMLEWMHDETVVKDMQADFSSKTLEDCNHFILSSKDTRKNLHLAIVDENDEYMGTVSLKNIEEDKAEFAITVRKNAMGKGYSLFGMREIIKIGLGDMNLSSIYWYVDKNNQRAIKFYDKKFALFKGDSKEDVIKAMQQAKTDVEENGNVEELLTQAEKQTDVILKSLFEDSIGDRELVIKHRN